MNAGDEVGPRVLLGLLGQGGNGEVWKAQGPLDPEPLAVKILAGTSIERLSRFKEEVAFLHEGRPGVLRMIDFDLPDGRRRTRWYSMPIAVRLRDALGEDPHPSRVIEAIASVATTLAALAEEGIGHRDIKPDNLFELDGEWLIGDFGLVTYPEKNPITEHGRRIGPTDYMAPEMRANADTADPEKADVYSLGKTLWVLLTGEARPNPGPHRIDDVAYSLASRLTFERTGEMDLLLERCTRHDPAERVPMMELARELRAALRDPPERTVTPDRSALRSRFLALTERARQEEDKTQRFNKVRNETWIRFRERIWPIVVEAEATLVGARGGTRDSSQALDLHLGATTNLSDRSNDLGVEAEFAYLDEGSPVVMLLISLGMRAQAPDLGTFVALIRVLARDEQPNDLWSFEGRALLGSAQVDELAERVRAGLESNLDGALSEVAMRVP